IVNNIALWNGDQWTSLTDTASGVAGTNNEIRAIALDENERVYVGGNFDAAGGNPAPRIAVWDGSTWGGLGEGTSGFVQAIHVSPDHVYAGGNFALAGELTVNRIARWDRDGLRWEGLGHGVSANVNALYHDGSNLYVAGNFETAADVENVNMVMKNMARWSGDDGWEALGPGTNVGTDSQIYALVPYGESPGLLASGSVTKAGARNVDRIAFWGTQPQNPPEEPIIPL